MGQCLRARASFTGSSAAGILIVFITMIIGSEINVGIIIIDVVVIVGGGIGSAAPRRPQGVEHQNLQLMPEVVDDQPGHHLLDRYQCVECA